MNAHLYETEPVVVVDGITVSAMYGLTPSMFLVATCGTGIISVLYLIVSLMPDQIL